MSGGSCCTCSESKLPIETRVWRVKEREWNSGAFVKDGGEPSDYSSVICMACHRPWRTKAKYVALLKDITEEEASNRNHNIKYNREEE